MSATTNVATPIAAGFTPASAADQLSEALGRIITGRALPTALTPTILVADAPSTTTACLEETLRARCS